MSEAWWPDALLFDVDGVLIDSLAVKGEAFADVFDDIPDSRQRVIDFHLANGGVTRSVKIAQLCEVLQGRAPSPDELQSRVDRFGSAVLQRVIEAPEIPGATDALLRWRDRCPLHAVSATPDRELRVIFEVRGLNQYFASVVGWPPTKGAAVADLLAQHAYQPARTVLVGDSHEDLLAAEEAGTAFIHLQGTPSKGLPGAHQAIADLGDLDGAVERVVAPRPV